MKIVLTTASPHSGHGQVFQLLCQAGLADAQPSRKEQLSPQALQTMLLRSYDVVLDGSAAITQQKPGKLWDEMAADLLLANIHQPQWGWADHQTLPLLDFWQDFDPQVRVLLVFDEPQAYIARALQALDKSDANSPDAACVDAVLQQWQHWNSALLYYFHRHTERCLLVNSQQALRAPQALLALLQKHWQIQLDADPLASSTAAATTALLPQYLAGQLLPPEHPAWLLAQELNSVAHLPASPAANASPLALWQDWRRLVQTQLSSAAQAQHQQQQLAQNQARIDAETLAKQQAEQALAQREAEHKQLHQLHQQLASQQQTQAQQARHHEAQQSALQHENSLLLQQLHQVQEELESAFLQRQSLEQAASQAAQDKAALIRTRDALVQEKAALVSAQAATSAKEKAALATANAKADASAKASADAIAKEKAALAQRDALATENKKLAQQITSLQQAQSAQQAQPDPKHSAQAAELQQENELLLLQLHQVQEELEHYFLQNQALTQQPHTLASNFASAFWRRHQPRELCIDLCGDIDGDNWYEAESDGRWAGPGHTATLQLPPLQAGRYRVELDIVDAMDLEIVRGLQLQALGQNHGLSLELPLSGQHYPATSYATLEISAAAAAEQAQQQAWSLGLHMPHLVCPADSGGQDTRQLGLRLRSVRLQRAD